MVVDIVAPFSKKLKGKENEVLGMYYDEKYSMLYMSQYFICSRDVLRKFFVKNNLHIRSAKEQKDSDKNRERPKIEANFGDYLFTHKNLLSMDEEIKNLYVDGYSARELAIANNVSECVIQNWLFKNGIKIRNSKEARNNQRYYEKQRDRLKYKFTPDIIEKIKNDYNEGYSAMYISANMGIDSSVVKRILKENGIQLRVGVDIHTDKKKEKFANTVFEKFGSWKGRHDIQKQKSMEKYGVENPMQVEDFFIKNQESGKKFKNAIVEGVRIIYQGYELRGIYRLLSEGYSIHDIKIGRNQVPSFRYFYDSKRRVYYPDIYIPKDNRIVEVKSKWTYENWLEQNLAKKQSVIDGGYSFDFYIM
jgi:transposase-like protein